jgi:hypothetical protein
MFLCDRKRLGVRDTASMDVLRGGEEHRHRHRA